MKVSVEQKPVKNLDLVKQEYLNNIQALKLEPLVKKTELTSLPAISKRLGTQIKLKREDQQSVFSFKIRGAFAKMQSLTDEERACSLLCQSLRLILKWMRCVNAAVK